MSYTGSIRPVWFHDGKSVLIRRNYNGGELLRVDLESGEARSIEAIIHTLLPTAWRAVVLSPDERVLYLSVPAPRERDALGTQWSIVRLDLGNGEQIPVWSSEGELQGGVSFAVSPDGTKLAIALKRVSWKTPHLIRVDMGTGASQDLAQSVYRQAVPAGEGLVWKRSGIYFLTDEEEANLMRMPTAGGMPERVGITIRLGGGSAVDVTEDGSRVVFSQSTLEVKGPLYVIENLTSLWKSTSRN